MSRARVLSKVSFNGEWWVAASAAAAVAVIGACCSEVDGGSNECVVWGVGRVGPF